MNELDADMWLAQRIACHANRQAAEVLGRVFAGDTTTSIRRDRFRDLILEHGLPDQVIGKKDGAQETYRSYFERRYQQPLEVPRGTSSDSHQHQKVTA
jgi:hypothetical protein